MVLEHENICDDKILQLHFAVIDSNGDLLPAHWHNHLEIILLIKGTMVSYVNDRSYQMYPGDILIVNPKDIHYTHTFKGSQYYLLQIPSMHLERMSQDWHFLRFQEYIPHAPETDSTSQNLIRIFNELKNLNSNCIPGYNLLFLIQTYCFLYEIYTRLSTPLSAQNQGKIEQDFYRIEQSMQYVKENFRKQISLSDIAEQLSLTPQYFCRLFKKYTGQTFFTYVNQVRLHSFYHDLLLTNDSITYLLEKNGFTNYKGFMREFKKAYGTTPYKLRASHKK